MISIHTVPITYYKQVHYQTSTLDVTWCKSDITQHSTYRMQAESVYDYTYGEICEHTL